MEDSRRTPSSTSKDDRRRSGAPSLSSDLFPELLSWSAFNDSVARHSRRAPSLLQGMPDDITDEDYIDDEAITDHERHSPLSLSRIFDPTTLAIGFDVSLLYGLDDQLVYSPKDAFADVCWLSGSGRRRSLEEDSNSEIIPVAKSSVRSSSYSGESDSGPDECKTDEVGVLHVGKSYNTFPTVEPATYVSNEVMINSS